MISENKCRFWHIRIILCFHGCMYKPEDVTECKEMLYECGSVSGGLEGAESKLPPKELGQCYLVRVCGLVPPETLISPCWDEFRNHEETFRNFMVIWQSMFISIEFNNKNIGLVLCICFISFSSNLFVLYFTSHVKRIRDKTKQVLYHR